MASYIIEVTCPECKEKRIITYSKKNVFELICLKCSTSKRIKGNISVSGYVRIGQKYEHRIVWENYNGKIPKGYVVHHKDGNRQNNDINNLELLSKLDHDKLTMDDVWDERRENNIKLFYPNKRQFDIEKIVDMLNQGFSLRKIAKSLNTCHNVIANHLNKNNIDYKKWVRRNVNKNTS